MSKPTSVLVLDDNKEFLNSISLLFSREPFAVCVTTHPFEALDILSRGTVKVVISDQRMPLVTGVDFLREVREHFPDVIRIILTGHTDMKAAETAINEGQVFAFFCKPCSPDTLITAVRKGLETYEQAVEERYALQAWKEYQRKVEIAVSDAKVEIEQFLMTNVTVLNSDQKQVLFKLAERLTALSQMRPAFDEE